MAVDYGAFQNNVIPYEMYESRARTSAHRVRRILFPEFPEGPTSSGSTFLDELAGPSVEVQNAVIDLLNVPSELQQLGQTLDACLSMLQSSDPILLQQATKEIYGLSKKDGILAQIASNDRLIKGLINAINSGDPIVQRDALAALAAISSHKTGQLCIFRSGGIRELIRMLRSPDESIRRYAVATLHNLLLYLETSKEEIIAAKGLEAMVPLLGEMNPKMQAMVADCIFHLMIERPMCKQIFLTHNGNEYLVRVLMSGTDYLKLIYAVLRCVLSVSTDQNNKVQLVDLQCLEALVPYLDKIVEPKRRLTLLNAIRNLSDAATNLDSLTGLLDKLLYILRETADDLTVSCICGILSNLTCNNINNKQTVTARGGIHILVAVAGNFSHIEDVTEPALCTLRHCTIRHDLADRAQLELRNIKNGFQILLCLLATRRPPIVKAALGVARNCAIQESNMKALIQERTPSGDDVVHVAIEVLEHSGFELVKDFDALTEGVSLLELVETTVSLLHQLARDPDVAKVVYTNDRVMQIIVSLLGMEQVTNSEDMLVMREVMGLLYQLSKTPDGQIAINNCGAIPFISYAYRSPNNAIAAYAAVLLRTFGLEQQQSDVLYHPNSRSSTDTLGSNGRIVQQEYRGAVGWVNEGLEPELYHEFLSTLGEMKHDHIEGGHGNSWFDTDL